MRNFNSISRRHFIEKAAVTAGLTALGSETVFAKPHPPQERLPREVWIATLSQEGLSAETPEKMVQTILSILKKSITIQPDAICLPEVFMTTNVSKRFSLEERVDLSAALLNEFMDFARTNRCYLICPMLTRENGKVYNAAVVIDRQGNRMGEYRKIHLPLDELRDGIIPGPLNPPVFKTDFGTIGIQICYDCNWNDGWHALRQQGAEIVFWPSAYPGGQVINGRAWENKYVVVSSTRGTSKICDFTGDVITQTGNWDRNLIYAPVNLEKAFLSVWPFVRHFDNIREKYGRKIKLTNYHEENWTIIESLSPDIRVADILKEYNISTFEQQADEAETWCQKLR